MEPLSSALAIIGIGGATFFNNIHICKKRLNFMMLKQKKDFFHQIIELRIGRVGSLQSPSPRLGLMNVGELSQKNLLRKLLKIK